MAIRRLWLTLGVAIVVLSAAPSRAASGNVASATGLASATVIQPIAVAEIADLDFGNVASDGAGLIGAGSVNVATTTPGATYAGASRNACDTGLDCPLPHAARFVVSGEAHRAYVITVPSEIAITPHPIAGDLTSGNATLVIDGIVVRTTSRANDGPAGQLDANGADSFDIGGRLQLPAGLAPARYSTVIRVVVAYS